MKRFSKRFISINYLLLLSFLVVDIVKARRGDSRSQSSSSRRREPSVSRRNSSGSSGRGRQSQVSSNRRQAVGRGPQPQRRSRLTGGREEVKREGTSSVRENIESRQRGRTQAATSRRRTVSQQERQVSLAQDELNIFSVTSLQKSLAELYKNAESLAIEQGSVHLWSLETNPSDYGKQYSASFSNNQDQMMEFHHDTFDKNVRSEYDQNNDEDSTIDIIEQEDGVQVVRTSYDSLNDYSFQIGKVKKKILIQQAALANEIFYNSMGQEDQDMFKGFARGLLGRGRRRQVDPAQSVNRQGRDDRETKVQEDSDESSLIVYDSFIRRMKRQDRRVDNQINSVHNLYYFLKTHPDVTTQDIKILFSGPTRMWGEFVRRMKSLFPQDEIVERYDDQEIKDNDSSDREEYQEYEQSE